MPATTPRSSPGREGSLDIRRESVWNLVSKFPTPFTSDSVTRKAREASHRRRKPKLEPLKIPGSPMSSFLDMSSPLETGTMKSASPYQHRLKSVADSRTAPDSSTGSLYSVSLGPHLSTGCSGRFIRRPSSEGHLSQLRSYWSDDSSNEDDEADDDDDDDKRSSPLSPTFLNSWRQRFGKTSMISHRHSRSLPSDLAPLSPLSKPMPGPGRQIRPLDDREEISICQALEDGPVVATTPRRWSHKQTVEDVALQFGQWRGFVSK